MALEIESGSLILNPELAKEIQVLHESSSFKTVGAFLKHLFALEEQNRSEQCLTNLFSSVAQPWIANYSQAANSDSVQQPRTASVGVQVKLCCQSEVELEMASYQQSASCEMNLVQQGSLKEEVTDGSDDDVDQSDLECSEAEERMEVQVLNNNDNSKQQTKNNTRKKTPLRQGADKPVKNRRKHQESGQKFTCEECGTKFTRKVYYVHHMKKHRGEETSQQCQYCPFTYPSPWTLTQHISHMHPEHAPPPRDKTPLKPFLCQICGAAMKTLYTYRQHQRIHTGERPYKCSQCGKTFTHSSGLFYHKRTHTKERSYPCHLCDKVFRYSSDVIKHQVVHTGAKRHTCHHCNKSFTEKWTLKEHILKQHEQPGLKPFECPHCHKSYSRKFSMNCHIKKKHLNPSNKKSDGKRSRYTRKEPVHISMTSVVSQGFSSQAGTEPMPKLLPEVSKSSNANKTSSSIRISGVHSLPKISLSKGQIRVVKDFAKGKSAHRQAEVELAEVMAEMLSS